jgi:Uma2 family endonuclease
MKGIQLDSPPRTIMEVYKSLPEGTLAELIDHVIYMSPAPLFKHQDILFEIAQLLRNHLKNEASGKLVIAPFDVYLDNSGNAVQPDITVVLNSNRGRLEGQFYGVPDLIVEVLSPGNKDHDLVKKKELYERFGVKEYWVVDPETKETRIFQLNQNKYVVTGTLTAKIDSPLLGFSFSF